MEISKGALGLVAAVGITAGAAGSYLATNVGTPAQGAQPTDAVVAVPPAATAADSFVPAPQDPVPARPVAKPAVDRRTVSADRVRPRRVRAVAPPPAEPAVDSVAPQIPSPAPAPAPEPLVERQPDLIAAVEQPKFEDLVLPAQSVIGIQLERTLSSETAQVEDEVVARVTRDVRIGDRVVIPAGARATGFVTLVERGGRLKDRSRLGFRFTSVTLADGTRVPIVTEAIFREGDSPRNESVAKIGGGAVGGAIIGGILGGAKGAAIGGSIGAGAGSAAVYAGGRNAATLPAGSPITVRLESPATITVER
jgi:hypothetical protein